MKLKDKVAIITGGSRGIGAGIAHAFASAGATVIIVNKSNPIDGVNIANQITQNGGKAHAIQCDIANESEVKQLVKQVIKQYNKIDILINAAGILVFKPVEEHTIDDWNSVINTNLKGAFLMSKEIIPHMKNKHYGKIIFVASLAATRGVANTIAYSASKGGLLAMAKSLVAEIANHGINVNIITPGFTATKMNEHIRNHPDFTRQMKATPAGNLMLQSEDISESAIYLASDDSKYVHGLNLIIDDGVSAVQAV